MLDRIQELALLAIQNGVPTQERCARAIALARALEADLAAFVRITEDLARENRILRDHGR